MRNQMWALMQLAWKRCGNEINTVISMYIGAWLFIALWLVFTIRNVADMQTYIKPVPVFYNGATSTDIVFGAAWNGLFNAVCFLTLLAIVICLLEYTGAFVIVAYHYDNESWEIPRIIKSGLNRLSRMMNEHRRKLYKASHERYLKDLQELRTEIDEIKKE